MKDLTLLMPVTLDAKSVPVESADISDETSPSEGPDHNMILVSSEVSSVSAQPAAIPATNPNPEPSAQANTKPKQQKRPLNDLEKSDIGQVLQNIKSHQKVTGEAVRGISDETSPSEGPEHNMIPVPSEVSSVSAQPAAIPATNPNPKPSAQANTRPKQQKHPLNDLEKSDIGQVFKDMIKSHQKVTVEAVRGKLKNSTQLVKVADRVSLCQTKSKSEAGGETENERGPQRIPAT